MLFVALLALPTRSWLWIGLLAATEELVTVPIATEALFGRGMSLAAMLWFALANVLTPLGPVVVAR